MLFTNWWELFRTGILCDAELLLELFPPRFELLSWLTGLWIGRGYWEEPLFAPPLLRYGQIFHQLLQFFSLNRWIWNFFTEVKFYKDSGERREKRKWKFKAVAKNVFSRINIQPMKRWNLNWRGIKKIKDTDSNFQFRVKRDLRV